MVDQAEIPRTKDYLFLAKSGLSSFFDPAFSAFITAEAIILGGAFGVVSNRIHSRFFGSDNSRLGVAVFLVAAAWGLGKVYNRIQSKRAAERLRRLEGDGNSEPYAQ